MKKKIWIIIGLIVFIAIAGGVSFGLLTYNKDIADVSLTTGNISISLANINGSINLTNVIPKSDNEGISSTDYIDFTVNASVDTENIYYEVYILPDSDNTLNTSYLKTYLTDQNNTALTGIVAYGDLINSESGNGKTIYRGLISVNNNYLPKNETKNFRLRLWLDEDYPDVVSKSFSFDIYLYAKNVDKDFRLTPAICKRATTLNTETCNQTSSYCAADGYTDNNTTITYGNDPSTRVSGQLVTGDAFDCNVDGTGYNKRFYYVSDRWNPGTDINDFDTSTAVLIYYSNTYNNGSTISDSYSGAAYYSSNKNYNGPVTAGTHLPTTSMWSNIELKETSRTIYSCSDENCTSIPSLETSGGLITPNPFSYTGKAARLLTIPELSKGCKSVNNNIAISNSGSLSACNFLFEGTKYADSSRATYGTWLETPVGDSSTRVYYIGSDGRQVYGYLSYGTSQSVRPVIEVAKADIEY